MKRFNTTMQSLLVIMSCFFLSTNSFCQDVSSFIEEVSLDSIEKTVRELSGEDSVLINGSKFLILQRGEDEDNELAADYIKQRLESYALDIFVQNYSENGKNIIATQNGTGSADSIIIICAHYDAVNFYCADDDASGCAAVIEAARILTESEFEHTIKYILFDEEEIGLVGSQSYVSWINIFQQNIKSVINVEMLGYESKNQGSGYDGEFDIITNNDPLSIRMKDVLFEIVDTYNLNLSPIRIWNVGGSDHASFWESGYPAICYSEAFHSGDPNPFYHTTYDRIGEFHMPYFHELVKLGVGSLAYVAIPVINTGITLENIDRLTVYPNPSLSNQEINILSDHKDAYLEVYQLMGRKKMFSQFVSNGKVVIKPYSLSSGVYIVKIISGNKVSTQQLIIL